MGYKRTKELFESLISEGLELDITDPNLKDTPERLARMYHNELIYAKKVPELTMFPNEGFDEIILLDNIPFTSLCSHHFVFFSGRAFFAYLPGDCLVGASKIARLIEYYCSRPQLQENLGIQIVDHFEQEIRPKGCMLVMRAVHNCMAYRGVKTGSEAGMMTSITRGCFREDKAIREEALNLIRLSIMDRG